MLVPTKPEHWVLLVVCAIVGGLLGAMAAHSLGEGHYKEPLAGLLLAAAIVAYTRFR